MVQFVIAKLEALMQAARDNYSVDPVVFLIIYLGSAPFFYYSLFRMIRALAKKAGKEVMLWSAVFLCANVAPFLYVLLFGRNLPWWVYGVIALLIGQGVFSLAIKLRKKPAVLPVEAEWGGTTTSPAKETESSSPAPTSKP
jgi:hypothetical protein